MRSPNPAPRFRKPAARESRGLRDAFLGLAVVVFAALPFAARADDDLPGRVGRIAEFAGQLFLSPQDRADEWAPIGINYPITTGDNLWVSGDGRAEIDYGGGQLRLAGDTSLNVSWLDDRQLALFIAQGRLIIRVRVLDAGDAAYVDTPNTQVAFTQPGLYRIDVAPDGQTTTSVREGEAFIALTSGWQQALPGQAVTVTGPEPAHADIRNGFGADGFDSWSADRDRRYEQSATAAFVSREMVGYAELDEYGVWETSTAYGPVWYPTAVAADWTPYRYGYWTEVGSWGLTWVDAAPWGYAPSHYGRWVRNGARWGWCPGARVAPPYWAPALVAWYGGGTWAISGRARSPVYGWVPLGWGDPYHPWWRSCSNDCWSRYNRPYAVNVSVRPAGPPARYSHATLPGAMTAVTAPNLTSRRPVPTNMISLPLPLATSAPVLATAPSVPPSPSHAPGLRSGERGTPAPASTFRSRSWPGRDAAARTSGPSTAAGAPDGAATAPRSSAGMPGAPSTYAPARSPAPTVSPPAGRGSAQYDGRPSPTTPAATGPGATVVQTPPARGGAAPQAPYPRPPALSGSTLPGSPPQRTPGPRGTPAADGGATGVPQAGSPGSGGALQPPPHSAQVPTTPSRAMPAPSLGRPAPSPTSTPGIAGPAVQPAVQAPTAPSRSIPAPSLGRPAPAPTTAPGAAAPTAQPSMPAPTAPGGAAPAAQQPAQAKPSGAVSGADAKAADKSGPGSGAVPR